MYVCLTRFELAFRCQVFALPLADPGLKRVLDRPPLSRPHDLTTCALSNIG